MVVGGRESPPPLGRCGWDPQFKKLFLLNDKESAGFLIGGDGNRRVWNELRRDRL